MSIDIDDKIKHMSISELEVLRDKIDKILDSRLFGRFTETEQGEPVKVILQKVGSSA